MSPAGRDCRAFSPLAASAARTASRPSRSWLNPTFPIISGSNSYLFKIKEAPQGGTMFYCEREGLTRHIHVPRPYGAALRAVKNASCIFNRTEGSSSKPPCPPNKKRPHKGVSFYLAEREGFEPSIRANVYTLSRRAPSAARTPLQILEAQG